MIRLNRPACPHPASLANRLTYKHPNNKAALVAATAGKCMYCEAVINHTQYGDVEHIVPKIPYAHLEFEWTNLGFACSVCNNNKNNSYDPNTPFIDPFAEDPTQHLVANGAHLFARPGSERGQLTIDVIDLNRAQLLERRTAKVSEVIRLVDRITGYRNQRLKDAARDIVLIETAEDKEYSLVARTVANVFLAHV